MHLSPGDADDGDAEQQAVENVGEANPDASYEEPQHVHEHAQTARLRWFPLHLRAEGPDGQHAQLHTLQAEWDADDGYHQHQSCDEILNGSMQPAKDQPNDVALKLHVRSLSILYLLDVRAMRKVAVYGQGRLDTSHIKAGMPITKISSPNR